MAGDLLLINMTYNDMQTLKAASGAEIKTIYHSDKSWAEYHNVLESRLDDGPPSNRTDLPAHAYVTFSSGNRSELEDYCNDKIQKARLNDVLKKLSRPLGVVTANPNLDGWPGGGDWDSASNLLIYAVNRGNVIIEYYKVDGSPIMNLYKNDPNWTKVPE